MFLHYILNRNPSDLLRRFFEAQCRQPLKNDWCETVKNDLISLNLNLDFETIRYLKKKKLSTILKKAIQTKSFEDLLEKQTSYSKGSNLSYGQFQMRSYFKSKIISTRQAKLVFQFRSRMVQVKENFKTNSQNLLCPCCLKEDDNQRHLIFCEKLTKSQVSQIEYNSIFGNFDEKICNVIPKLEILLTERKSIIEDSK